MISKAGYDALRAAVDIAYEGIEFDNPEREAMAKEAEDALEYIRGAMDAPRATGSRWRRLTSSLKGSAILQTIKGVAHLDPRQQVVALPEVDFARWSGRTVYLEEKLPNLLAQIEVLTMEVRVRDEEIEDLKHEHPVFVQPADTLVANYDKVENTSGIGPDDEINAGPAERADLEAKLTKFQEHMNRCSRCAEGPASMCSIGKILLSKQASGT